MVQFICNVVIMAVRALMKEKKTLRFRYSDCNSIGTGKS